MSSNFHNFEWYIGEDGWLLQPVTNATLDHSSQKLLSSYEQRVVWGFLRSLLFFFIALIITSGASLSQKAYEYGQWRDIVDDVLLTEKAAWQADDRLLLATTVDPVVADTWAPQWRKYWRGNVGQRSRFAITLNHIEEYTTQAGALQAGENQSYLFAEVIDQRPPSDWWLVSPTRETRIFTQLPTSQTNAQQEREWVRTVPPPSYWGKSQRLNTSNVQYEFFERDHELVQSVAPAIERHYQRLFQLLNLPLLDNESQFTVRILPDPRQGRVQRSTILYVTSPVLATKPMQLSDKTYVERLVVDQMTAFAVNQLSDWRGSDNIQWSTIIWALRSQLEEALMEDASPWFQQSEPLFIEYGQTRFPIALEDLTRIRKPKIDPDRRHIFWQQVGAELVINYAFTTYGIESSPKLIQAFSHNHNWEQLIPDVYGVSAEEFERGFNQFLAQRYGWIQ